LRKHEAQGDLSWRIGRSKESCEDGPIPRPLPKWEGVSAGEGQRAAGVGTSSVLRTSSPKEEDFALGVFCVK
jgi:hypothetical protein